MERRSLESWGIAVIRMVTGAVFVAHGLQKLLVFGLPGVAAAMGDIGLPWPMASALAVTATELVGGLALVIGLFTRLAAIPIAFAMLVAMLSVHLPNGFFLPNGIEYTVVLFATDVGLALAGPGAFALDHVIRAHGEGHTRRTLRQVA